MNTISNLKPGDSVETFFLIKDSKQGVTTQGKPYMSFILQDKSGDIDAKLWTVTKEEMDLLTAGTIIKVKADVIDYRGKKQMKVLHHRHVNEDDNVLAKDFVETAPLTEDDLYNNILDYVLKIDNSNLHRITRHLLSKHKDDFLRFPAAKINHHDFHSGLAYHVLCMLKQAEGLIDIYPAINQSLLYSGIILHDIGKIRELSGPVGVTYTTEGNLLGHIVIAYTMVTDAAKELDIDGEDVMVLQHMILSHHGKLEYGSPKVPMLLEAEILHFIDNIDARIMMVEKNLKSIEPGQFSDRIFPLDNRIMYKRNEE